MVGMEIVDFGNIHKDILCCPIPIVRLPLLSHLTNINKIRMGTHKKTSTYLRKLYFYQQNNNANESAHRGKYTLSFFLDSYNEKATKSYTPQRVIYKSASVLAEMCSSAILHSGVHSASIFSVAQRNHYVITATLSLRPRRVQYCTRIWVEIVILYQVTTCVGLFITS